MTGESCLCRRCSSEKLTLGNAKLPSNLGPSLLFAQSASAKLADVSRRRGCLAPPPEEGRRQQMFDEHIPS